MRTQAPSPFLPRHLGITPSQRDEMLSYLGLSSLEELMQESLPPSIALSKAESLRLTPPLDETAFLREIRAKAQKNKLFKHYIGLGYHDCAVPPVILRNVFENPGWYTAYTPYQSEISQGRLEALFHFQTMIVELSAMEIANASLLDEATAAAEAMAMLFRLRSPQALAAKAKVFFVSQYCFLQSIEVLHARAERMGIEIELGDEENFSYDQKYFAMLLQYPNAKGRVKDYRRLISQAHSHSIGIVMAADPLSLCLLEAPGALGADICVGSAQRFGTPMGFGGPHAAFLATWDKNKRAIPGRIVGQSIDRRGQRGYRLALQTREQHIRKEKASSNICTAQALLAVMSAMYAIYHGPEGLKAIARRIHRLSQDLNEAAGAFPFLRQNNEYYFDTLHFSLIDIAKEEVRRAALAKGVNLCYHEDESISISLNETTSKEDVQELLAIFADLAKNKGIQILQKPAAPPPMQQQASLPKELLRRRPFLTQEVFHNYHSETAMMRYMRRLEAKDIALNHSMIPLGSCTMKLNPAAAMLPVSMREFASLHPFAPLDQAAAYLDIFQELEEYLGAITGMDAVSLQPNSGAQGEYAGLLVIRAYHQEQGEGHRNLALIPASAHGTNPASAAMAGMEVLLLACDKEGNIDLEDLTAKAQRHKETLACLMLTYPSTHGVFEENIRQVCQIIHDQGALVYLDGANMNAQMGLSNPRKIGADLCHLNLHKTFSIPHGGGGPGMGPICVIQKLAPFLPRHPFAPQVGGKKAIRAVAAAPWGSASILLISYAYIRLLGAEGLKASSQHAILSANYIKKRLERDYNILYSGPKGRVAHEMIVDLRCFQKYNIQVEDIAKRLVDYSFHAPTMSWPVPGSLMIEPTESETKEELDRFCDAMLGIRAEIEEIAQGRAASHDNLLKNAPHPPQELLEEAWPHPYSPKQAAYPMSEKERAWKFWPPIARIDNAYGDRNLICSCPPPALWQKEASGMRTADGH